MSKPEATGARKNSLGPHEEKIMRWTKLNGTQPYLGDTGQCESNSFPF